MGAAPMDGLIFKGKLAIYSIWGAHAYYDDASQPSLKDWAASSKASDSVMRVKRLILSTQVLLENSQLA